MVILQVQTYPRARARIREQLVRLQVVMRVREVIMDLQEATTLIILQKQRLIRFWELEVVLQNFIVKMVLGHRLVILLDQCSLWEHWVLLGLEQLLHH